MGRGNGSSVGWVLTPEMRALVPEFWLRFPPPPLSLHYTLGAIYLVIMVVGLTGNIIIIWLFATTKRLRKPSNYLVVNLALSDILMLHKMIIFSYNSFSGGPAAGAMWCTYYGVMGGLSGTSAIMTIAMMSVERYMCVSRPLDPAGRMTSSRALVMVIFVWAYSALFSFLPLFGINRYVPEGFLTSCSFDYLSDNPGSKAFVLCFFAAAWCLPVIVICRCYVGIVLSVMDNERLFQQHAQTLRPDRNVAHQKQLEIRLAKISFVLISLWTLSWTPYAVVALLGVLSDRSMLSPLGSMVPALFCKLASVLDPIIYGLSNQTFKGELFRKILAVCKSGNLQNKEQLPSFLKRAISARSVERTMSENGEYDDEYDDDDDDDDRRQASVRNQRGISEYPMKPLEVKTVSKEVEEKAEVELRGSDADSIGEGKNTVLLQSVKVFQIPQICAMERKSDIIKMTTRRSF